MKVPGFLLFLSLLLLPCGVAAQTQVMPEEQRSARQAPRNKAEKAPVDSSVYGKWPSVGYPAISNDGRYARYTIKNQPVGSQTLVMMATSPNWKLEIPGGSNAWITENSKQAVFNKPTDTLGIVTLGTSSIEYISHVNDFKLPKRGNGEWLAYRLKGPSMELVLRHLPTEKEISVPAVRDYLFTDDGSALLVQTESANGKGTTKALSWVSLPDGKTTTIWHGAQAGNFIFDASNTQLAFTVEDKVNDHSVHSFWYYKMGTDKAAMLADDYAPGIDNGLRLNDIQAFSKDGRRLIFRLMQVDPPAKKLDVVGVDVWSYKDTKLQSLQLTELAPKSFTAVIHIDDHCIIRLLQDNERSDNLASFSSANYYDNATDDFAIVYHTQGDPDSYERSWNSAFRGTTDLVSTNDGRRKSIRELQAGFGSATTVLSPEGKYAIYYDEHKRNYFSYEVSSGIVRNITKGIPVTWTVDDDKPESPYLAIPVAGWMKGDWAVLLYDRYDIWQVDPKGDKPAVNITNGYGRRHDIELRLGMEGYYSTRVKAVDNNEKLILSAFSKSTKHNGFYSKVVNEKGDPQLLTMGPYVYDAPIIFRLRPPVKARDAETYIVERESSTESPNYFCSRDLKSFTALSTIHPEKAYNWLTAELVTWKTLNGSTSQGVLYKPENFDPEKKYPVIFHYYEKLSNELNIYQIPDASEGGINIPWFVSHGYVVFTPDIHYKIGETGESVVNAVVSAAQYLSTMPWVDGRKMGLNGQSFGGYETNYLVTHTHLFAAASSSSGYSDLVSSYGSLWGNGSSSQEYSEVRSNRIGVTLWQAPNLYLTNSPIFQADRMTTPLLMMNNKKDAGVPFAQGVEFFTALRRLGKKVWLLQYDDGKHEVSGKSAEDYSIRLGQFFDHYLKGAPPPKWMTEGVPARLKGIDSGLGLDTSGKQP